MTPDQSFQGLWELSTVYFVPTLIVLLLAIAGIYAKFGRWINAGFYIALGVVLGAGEGVSIYFTGKTISTNHWELVGQNPELGGSLDLLIALLFIVVIVHLAKVSIKRIKKS